MAQFNLESIINIKKAIKDPHNMLDSVPHCNLLFKIVFELFF